MYHREIDSQAYLVVRGYELLLRRMLRWKIKGFFGPTWYTDLTNQIVDIEDKIAAERSIGLSQPSSSPFSYLDFVNLIDLMFKVYWEDIFSKHLQPRDRGAGKNDLHVLRHFRNKIGHFRSVTADDFSLVEPACKFLDDLQGRYKSALVADWHVSGAPEFVSDQLFSESFSECEKEVAGTSAETLFSKFSSTYSLIETGIYPGMGFVDGQYFFEFYTKGSFDPAVLVDFFLKHDFEISFANLGSKAHFIRIFISEKFDDTRIVSLHKKFQKAAKGAVRDFQLSSNDLNAAYDIGLHDGFNVDAVNTHLGFVF